MVKGFAACQDCAGTGFVTAIRTTLKKFADGTTLSYKEITTVENPCDRTQNEANYQE